MNFNINKVAVIGAGVMGSGIAAHIVGAGIPVCLLDIVPKELTEEDKAKKLTMESKAFRNKFAQAGKDRVANPKNKAIYDVALAGMIEVGNLNDNLDMLSECDWIIEVVVENLEVKKSLIKTISDYIKPGTIVSSNTSGVSINKIVEDMPLEFRKNFMGTHFFNPPRFMKLFELIPAQDTLPELIQFMAEFGTKRLGKGVVFAKDTPNFIGNRIGTFSSVNVMQLMEKYGYDIPKIDKLTGTILGRPKSATFRTIDMVGLDILYHVVGNVIKNVNNDSEKAMFKMPEFYRDLMEKGFLGDKAKQGFYKKVKTEKGKQVLCWDKSKKEYVEFVDEKIEAIENVGSGNKLQAIIYGQAEENKFIWEVIKNVLLYSASKVPEIADDYKEIDNAMMWGFNWEMGPFAIWDAIGFEKSVEKMKAEGEVIPQWIEDKLNSNSTKFYNVDDIVTPYITISSHKNPVIIENKDTALVDIGDGVACLQFKSNGNLVTEEVTDLVSESIKIVEKDYKGLVIGNQSKGFSSGANLKIIGGLIQENNWDKIEVLVDKLQKSNMAIKYCKKPIVAAPYGICFGGGAEIAMHTHKQLANAETYMGLVEAGVGLVTGGGGTKEVLIRNTENLGNVSNGELFTHVRKTWETVAMGKVSGSAHEAIKIGYMRSSDKIVMSKEYLIDEAKKEVLHLSEGGFRPVQKKLIKVLGTTGMASLEYIIEIMLNGRFISEYDAHIAKKYAKIITGGDVPCGVFVTEEQILEIEKEAFLSLCGEEKTKQRIEYMIKKGKPLRN